MSRDRLTGEKKSVESAKLTAATADRNETVCVYEGNAKFLRSIS